VCTCISVRDETTRRPTNRGSRDDPVQSLWHPIVVTERRDATGRTADPIRSAAMLRSTTILGSSDLRRSLVQPLTNRLRAGWTAFVPFGMLRVHVVREATTGLAEGRMAVV
jgi:hypothetical protein